MSVSPFFKTLALSAMAHGAVAVTVLTATPWAERSAETTGASLVLEVSLTDDPQAALVSETVSSPILAPRVAATPAAPAGLEASPSAEPMAPKESLPTLAIAPMRPPLPVKPPKRVPRSDPSPSSPSSPVLASPVPASIPADSAAGVEGGETVAEGGGSSLASPTGEMNGISQSAAAESKGGTAFSAAAPSYRLGEARTPHPTYPFSARKRGIEGRVVVHIEVDAAGEVVSAKVQESSGYEALDAAALSALRQWRLTPAQADGHPVPGSIQVPIRFVLND